MAFWNGSGGSSSGRQQEPLLKETNKSSRFYYDSGDKSNPLLFKGLTGSVKPTLRSLYLEHCYFDADVLINSLDGCVNLAIIKLYNVEINHGRIEVPMPNFKKLHFPKLNTLYVHDVSGGAKAVLDSPFHKVKDEEKIREQRELAQYTVEFYSQFLQAQLGLSGCKYLYFCKFNVVAVNLTIKLHNYTILKYSPLSTFEKLVISPLLDASKNQFLKNDQDQLKLRHLACSDKVLTVVTTPRSLEDLNLYLSGEENPTLLVDLVISQKLACLSSLTLYFHKRQIVDLSILSSGLKNLKELVIHKAIIHSKGSSPFVVTEVAFDQCTFSELFMTNVPALLNCTSIAIDVQRVPTWNGIFKTRLMTMSKVVRIVIWAVDTSEAEDKITFSEIYSKRQSGSSFVWQSAPFDDPEMRRSILLNHRDFFQVQSEFPINLLESEDVPEGASLNLFSTARNTLSSSFFAILMAVVALMIYSYQRIPGASN